MSDAASLKDATLPVDSYREAAPHLRRPFTPEAVKWKVQAGTLVVPYIDARLAIERLNRALPHLWQDEYEPIAGGKGLLCRLTIDGITRFDVGEKYTGKGLYSDAFKRAAVKFGVGVSLYALPKVFLSFEDGHLKKGEKNAVYLTDSGRQRLDSGYRAWLKKTGEPMFGPVLDHGDVADAMGDVEAGVEAPAADAPEPAPQKLTDSRGKALIAGAEKLYADLPKEAKGAKGLTPAAFKRSLEGAWHSHETLEKLIADLEKRNA